MGEIAAVAVRVDVGTMPARPGTSVLVAGAVKVIPALVAVRRSAVACASVEVGDGLAAPQPAPVRMITNDTRTNARPGSCRLREAGCGQPVGR